MGRIFVTGAGLGVGTTTIAVGLAKYLIDKGYSVSLDRFGSDDRANEDFELFKNIGLNSANVPLTLDQISDPPADGINQIIELPHDTKIEEVHRQFGAQIVYVQTMGSEKVVPEESIVFLNRAQKSCAGILVEDRILASPRVIDLVDVSKADVLVYSSEGENALCENILAGAISHDPADDYFQRFANAAVVTRNGRVDLALATMLSGAKCLILSGGGNPSPYILDRAASDRSTTILLTEDSTVDTIKNIQSVFATAPFSGDEKVKKIMQLFIDVIDDDLLQTLTN
ncbi:MAG: hypothetical protein CL792_02240 [Chloroflexi bacterium]|nr:hypothetical protein [Chloroflexota bacterium]|tara:strand:+ start:18008 stop:18862 length:855 start_codon:yes stop_codon:yes gene_type:complete